MSDMRKLLESMDQFAGEKVGQKPGDQVRGTEKATKRKNDKHPFAGRLVGASESKNLLVDLEKKLKENVGRHSLAEEFARFKEDADTLNVGDPVVITGKVQFNGTTGEIDEFSRDKRFVIVNLYNHGKHSFHSSDVSYNDYADSDEEEARMYDAGEFKEAVQPAQAAAPAQPAKPAVAPAAPAAAPAQPNPEQSLLDRMGKRFGLPPGSTAEQVQAAQQAYLDKNDPAAAAQYKQNMANIDAGNTAATTPVKLAQPAPQAAAPAAPAVAPTADATGGQAAAKANKSPIAIMLAQPTIANNQQMLDVIAPTLGLPAGSTIQQILAADDARNAAAGGKYAAGATVAEGMTLDNMHLDRYDKLDKLANKEQGVAEAGYPEVDHMPGPTIKRTQTGCKRCHGKGYVYKTPDGEVHPMNRPDAKKYKCGKCGGIGFVKVAEEQGVAETRKANTARARAEFSKRPRKADPAIQDKKKAESDEAWARLMAYADEQKKKEQGVAEGYNDEENPIRDDRPVEAYGYAYNNRDQRVMWRKEFSSGEAAYSWAEKKNATVLGTRPLQQIDEETNPTDTVTLDVPLLIRLLEYSREDANTDMDLHSVAERLIVLSASGQTLSMDQYDQIIPGQETVDEDMPPAAVPTAGGVAGATQPKQTAPGQPVDPAALAAQKAQQAKLQQNLAGLKTAGVQIDPAKAAQSLQKTDTGAPMNAMDKDTIAKLAPAIGNVMTNPATATQLNTLIKKAGGGV